MSAQPALARAQQAKFLVLRTEELADLGVKITVLQTPAGMSASRGLKKLRKLDPEGTYDFNHVYLESGESMQARSRRRGPSTRPATGGGAVRVGLIDGGMDGGHQVSRSQRRRSASDAAAAPVPNAHGTAVARGRILWQFQGAASGARSSPRMCIAARPPEAPSMRWPRRWAGWRAKKSP